MHLSAALGALYGGSSIFHCIFFWKIASARITQAQPAPSATVATEFRDGLPSTNGFFRHNLVTLRTGGWRPLSRKASCRLVSRVRAESTTIGLTGHKLVTVGFAS